MSFLYLESPCRVRSMLLLLATPHWSSTPMRWHRQNKQGGNIENEDKRKGEEQREWQNATDLIHRWLKLSKTLGCCFASESAATVTLEAGARWFAASWRHG